MTQAVKVAERGIYTTDPNPAIGCLLVKNNQILAEGYTQRAGFAHAEIDALSKTTEAKGATAYVTLEPCNHFGRTGPCTEALLSAGISRVVIAMSDPNPLVSGSGIARLQAAGIEVISGVLEQEARKLNKGFFKRMTQGLPWITSKLAISLDGRTALASGESKWISSTESRQDVQKLRAANSAIVTGIGTVLHDDPLLTARVDFDFVPPIRVVLDSALRMPLTAKMLKDDQPIWIITGSDNVNKQQQLENLGCKIWQIAENNNRPNLNQVFSLLAQQQINSVWIEAGAQLNGCLLDSNLVDEWLVYLAPCVLGDNGRGMFHCPSILTMAEKKQLSINNFRPLGTDLRLSLSYKELKET